jgi:hypothetical protein
VYSYNTAGHYFYKQGEGDTFKKLISRVTLAPPVWVLLVTDAALVLPIRIAEDAIPALGQRWRRLEELTGRHSKSRDAKP